MNADSFLLRRSRSGRVPALLRHGFRPFFLGAGIWALVALAVWVAMFSGLLDLPTAFGPLAWHAHEMIFGYGAAAVAGFLLTAIPNWTGRLPVRGSMLGALALLWLAGRVATAGSAAIGASLAAVVDLAFPAAMVAVVAREVVAGRNWRNLPMPVALLVLFAANLLMHLEALGAAQTGALGQRLGIGVLLMLIALIGGRIIPSFTGNWLKKRGLEPLPAPFGLTDKLALAVTVGALLAWVVVPESRPTAALAALAGLAIAVRLSRWRGHRTLAEPLLWVLHLGYGWLAVGLLLLAAPALWPAVPPSAALHALTVGAIGTMTLAVMTRATLGHSGRALTAGPASAAAYLLVSASALLRIASPFAGAYASHALTCAGLAWIAAFGLFLAVYAPMLLLPRKSADA